MEGFIKQNVGIDIAKDDFKACFSVMTSTQDVVVKGRATFSNTVKGFATFSKWVTPKNLQTWICILQWKPRACIMKVWRSVFPSIFITRP
jgi:hypothetical protein